MNVATVFKQSTTTSARMSTNIHHTELSSIRFDQLNRQKINSNGQKHHQQQQQYPPKQASLVKKAITTATVINNKQVKTTTVLMESNSVLNMVQETDNEHLRRRRHSLSVRDERLLKILSAPPDEPLYINGTPPNHKIAPTFITDNNCLSDNLLIQYEAATSSITGRDEYENENLPPTNDNKNAATNNEGY